jgi:hypothetical protein
MARDRKSLLIVQNRVVAILDIGRAPTSMIWAFDFKKHKQAIIQYKYDRKYGRVFAVLKNGLLVALGKDKDNFELSLQDSFGKFTS